MPLGLFKSKYKASAASNTTDPSLSHASGHPSSSAQLERLSLESPLLKESPSSPVATLDRNEVYTDPSDKGLSLGGFYCAFAVSRIILRERHLMEQGEDPRQILADTSSKEEQGYYSIKELSKKTMKRLQNSDPNLLLQLKTNLRVEASYLAKLQHEHIWTLEGMNDTTKQQPFLITHRIVETLEGRLEQWQQEHLQDPESHAVDPQCPMFAVKMEYAKQILSALQYLHQHGIVGLGFTPASFGFLSSNPNRLQLCDLGTCREISAFMGGSKSRLRSKDFQDSWNGDNSHSNISLGGPENGDNNDDSLKFEDDDIGDGERFAVVGGNSLRVDDGLLVPLMETGVIPRYRAPEIVTRGAEAVTLQADVYTWAMIFVEMITLQKPYAHFKTGQHTVKVCMEGKRPNLSMYPHLPLSMGAVLKRCWRHSEDKRWSSSQAIEAVEKVMKKHILQSTRGQPEAKAIPEPSALPKTKVRRASSSDIMAFTPARSKSLLSRSKDLLMSISMRDYEPSSMELEPLKSAIRRSSFNRSSSDKRLLTNVLNDKDIKRLPRRTKSGDRAMKQSKSLDTDIAEATMDTSSGSQTKRSSGQKKSRVPRRTRSGDRAAFEAKTGVKENAANSTRALPHRTHSGRKPGIDTERVDEVIIGSELRESTKSSPGREEQHDTKSTGTSMKNKGRSSEGHKTVVSPANNDINVKGSSEPVEQPEMDDSNMSTQSQKQKHAKASNESSTKKRLPRRTRSGDIKKKKASAVSGSLAAPGRNEMDDSILSSQSQELRKADLPEKSNDRKTNTLRRRTHCCQKGASTNGGNRKDHTELSSDRPEEMMKDVSSKSAQSGDDQVSPNGQNHKHEVRRKRRSVVPKTSHSTRGNRDELDLDVNCLMTKSTPGRKEKLEEIKLGQKKGCQRKGRAGKFDERHQYSRPDTLDKRGVRHRTVDIDEQQSTEKQ